jgi:hypothetical protein
MRRRTILAVASAIALGAASRVQAQPTPQASRRGVYLEAPLADGAIDGAQAQSLPTMQQSLWVATNAYVGAHYGIASALDPYGNSFWKAFFGRLLTGVADLALIQLPFGAAWQHEEWHRAVLGARGIHSYNDVYNFELFASTIAVSHVPDSGLVRLKAEHPPEIVRMGTAGIEGNYQLATNIEKVAFFYRPRTYDGIAITMLYAINSAYMFTCASPDADREVDKEEREEGANVTPRDFTGLDCLGWTYDLFRPNEPYEARGVHPSGVGVRRYRRWADLHPEEREYLETHAALSLLNFIDPAVAGFDSFTAGSWRFNAHVRHQPTSFGSATMLEGFVQRGPFNVFAGAHGYFNRNLSLPGLAMELVRYPLPRIEGRPSWLGARASLWLQPDSQSFETTRIAPGGLFALRFGYEATSALSPFVEIEGKTAGWVAGSVALGPSLAFRSGLSLWVR